MPATLTAAHISPAGAEEDICADCHGTLVIADSDGSLSGTFGALVTCGCVYYETPAAGECPCRVEDWPWNGGFTGWVPNRVYGDDEVCFLPCARHPRLQAAEVAA